MRSAIRFAALVLAGILAACATEAPSTAQPTSPEPPPGASVAAPSTPSPTPQPTARSSSPTPGSAADAISWRQLAHVIGEGQVRRVVAEAGSVWAVGFTGHTSSGLGGAPVIWRSDAAEEWIRVTLPIPESASLLPQVLVDVEHLASAAGRLFAFGSVGALDSSMSVVWESADGLTWTETIAPPVNFVSDVTGGPSALVVVGRGYGEASGSVWSSRDGGSTWAESSPFEGNGTASAVVGTSDGYVLAGAVSSSEGQAHPRIWLSSDAQTWTEANLEESDAQASVSAVTLDGSGRWVALGFRGSDVTTWRSADGGQSWEVSGDIQSAGDAPHGMRLTGLARGFVVVDFNGRAWFSDDGAAWDAVDPWPVPQGGESAGGVARVGDSLALVHNDAPFTTGGSADEGWTVWTATISR